ncbi:MAG: methyltransferase type 12 [Parcubacteria group bacterium Gr01-1014_56]|nr:MAG: methyltransferase type 12 [Parcubacteria group bacterium Gr01-1014_56]
MNEHAGKIFEGAARHYAQYRAPYPKELFEDIIEYFNLDGKGSLLDLGCGTGEITVPLSLHFEKVIGLDPSPDMLEEARERAQKAQAENIVWMERTAEELDSSFGSFRLTTIARAFHWMNQNEVLKKIYDLTDSGGGLAIISTPGAKQWDQDPNPWLKAAKTVVQKYLGPERKAGITSFDSYRASQKTSAESIQESPFQNYEKRPYPYRLERNIDEVMGLLYSSSYATKRLFGEKVEEFEREVRTELSKLEPSGRFIEERRVNAYFARKI